MRVIAGIRRGMRLLEFDHPSVRPTADKIKGSIFNMIMNEADISRCRVLDLFSGTGNLGIEALSRGALHGTFVENDGRALELLKNNIQKAKFASVSEIRQEDVRSYLSRIPERPFELIFSDPPYETRLGSVIASAVIANAFLAPGGLLILESSADEAISAEGLEPLKDRVFRDTKITILKSNASTALGS